MLGEHLGLVTLNMGGLQLVLSKTNRIDDTKVGVPNFIRQVQKTQESDSLVC